MRKATFTALAVFTLLTSTPLLTRLPANASQRTVREAGLLRLIDEARERRGLAPLCLRAALDGAALEHSREMVERGYFSHLSLSGASCATRVLDAGYARGGCSSWAVAEIIGRGVGAAGTPRTVFGTWMRSAYHRAIILGPRWRDVGVGCAPGTFCSVAGAWMYTVDVGHRGW